MQAEGVLCLGRWYRVLVVVMAMTAILCTLAAGYAGVRLIGAGKQMLSNEMLIREISEWWMENTR